MKLRRLALRTLAVTLVLVTAPVLAIVAMAALPPSVERGARTRAWLMDADYLGVSGVQLQQNRNDCAVAALEMLVAHVGRDPRPLAPWHETVRARGEGMTLLEMQRAAATVGVRTHGVRADARSLRFVGLPAIVHFDNHFVVLDSVDASGAVAIRDPASGRLHMGRDAFAEAYTGDALALVRTRRAEGATR